MHTFSFSRLAVLFPVAVLLLAPRTGVGEPQVLNAIRAVVNGQPITQMEVDSAVQTQLRVWIMENQGMVSRSQVQSRVSELEERALEDLIDRKLILSEFEKLGGQIKEQHIDMQVNRFVQTRFEGDREKFAAELKESGMTIAQFRDVQKDQIAINALRSQHAGDEVIPNTPWEKRRKYNEIKGDFASEGKVKLRIMSIPKEKPTSNPEQQKALVEQLRSRLQSGADFGALASEYSSDSFAGKGGYIGVIGKDGSTVNPRITQVAYSLPSGGISPAIDGGPVWWILKSEGRVGRSVPSFDELEDEVDKRLTIDKRQEKLDNWLKKLRRQANVRIYE